MKKEKNSEVQKIEEKIISGKKVLVISVIVIMLMTTEAMPNNRNDSDMIETFFLPYEGGLRIKINF